MLNKLSQQITQTALNKLAAPDEAIAIVLEAKCPNIGIYAVKGKTTKRFVFPFYSRGRRKGHILRVPLSVWNAKDMQFAKELLDRPQLPVRIIITAEPWDSSLIAPAGPIPGTPFPQAEPRQTDPSPTGPALSAIPIGEPQPPADVEVKPAAPFEVDLPIRRDGDDFFIGDEKIGGINSAGHLQMSKGKQALRPAVQALLDTATSQ